MRTTRRQRWDQGNRSSKRIPESGAEHLKPIVVVHGGPILVTAPKPRDRPLYQACGSVAAARVGAKVDHRQLLIAL